MCVCVLGGGGGGGAHHHNLLFCRIKYIFLTTLCIFIALTKNGLPVRNIGNYNTETLVTSCCSLFVL